ncbi:cyclic nucleotide-gated cation channel alpha-3 [Caerostris extrusa]|uniref:Cyclic nucleotide-gated cation channel alpha-3 n=1 Tax=Caerostris extrusa TaxID=172846 RepID=A0AAV4MJC7_CAEEX|nr:cyclic nucleotide-gated cation channel alpha-3 [Caerostris extrusa]
MRIYFRFLKARRIYKFYYAVESRTAYPNLWRVANLIHVLLLLAHWFGCFYYMLSELEGFKGNWAYKHPESPEHSPLVRKYLGSVYWSTLTLTTIGDLATPPQTYSEWRLFHVQHCCNSFDF